MSRKFILPFYLKLSRLYRWEERCEPGRSLHLRAIKLEVVNAFFELSTVRMIIGLEASELDGPLEASKPQD